MLHISRLPRANCPACLKTVDAASGPSGADPEPGDFTVCLGCGNLAAYLDNMQLRAVNAAELAAQEPGVQREIAACQRTVRAFRAALL